MTTPEKLLEESRRLVHSAALDIYEGSDRMEETGLIHPSTREEAAKVARRTHPDTMETYKSNSKSNKPLYQPKTI